MTDRMNVWLTPSMVAPDSVLFGRLEEIARTYDELQASNTLTVGVLDMLLAESDKIQAELFRRAYHKMLELKEASLV